MGKQGEIDYAQRIGADGRRHAADKPFSDNGRGRYLQQMGTVLEQLPPPPARILDLGCGTGWTTDFLHRSGYDATGIDIAPDMIDLARSVPGRDGVAFQVCDYEQVAELGTFDAAMFFDSLHHAEDERVALQAAFDALGPSGVLVLNEPGIGHHLTAESVRAMKEFGVTEKEMPARHIIDLALEIGFSRWKVLPDPNQLIHLAGEFPRNSSITHRFPALKRLVAAPVVRLLGGRPRLMTDDLSDFAFLKITNRFLDGVDTQGGITVLYV